MKQAEQAGSARSIRAGIYQHYKGPRYRVYGVAEHSESGEVVVVYRALYGERGLWVRPLDMFAGSVERNGTTVPRFRYLAGEEAD